MNAPQISTLENYDATALVGLRVLVMNAAIQTVDEDGEVDIEVPDVAMLSAMTAISRCLLPIRLRGRELRAIRRIIGLSAIEMAEKLDQNMAPETLSRWENEKQPMGGYAEKVFRLVACHELVKRAPGSNYRDGAIAELNVIDPWRANPDYEVPAVIARFVKVKAEANPIIDAWTPTEGLAA